MKYNVKFEFFGKYMQTTVDAENVKHAKYIVKNRINFISVAEEPEPTLPRYSDEDIVNFLLGSTGWKK